MTIKEKLQRYRKAAERCKSARCEYANQRQAISRLLNRDERDSFVCIKIFYKFFPYVNTADISENAWMDLDYCHRFQENPCPIHNCPYIEQNKKYHIAQKLYEQARAEKQAAFKNIFVRIK